MKFRIEEDHTWVIIDESNNFVDALEIQQKHYPAIVKRNSDNKLLSEHIKRKKKVLPLST